MMMMMIIIMMMMMMIIIIIIITIIIHFMFINVPIQHPTGQLHKQHNTQK